MGSKSKVLFDLNELPAEIVDDDSDDAVCLQPQRTVPFSGAATNDLFVAAVGSQRIVNNLVFSHASSASGFQPFVRPNIVKESLSSPAKGSEKLPGSLASSPKAINVEDAKFTPTREAASVVDHVFEKEEGEWSDTEGSVDTYRRSVIGEDLNETDEKHELEKDPQKLDDKILLGNSETPSNDSKSKNGSHVLGSSQEMDFQKDNGTTNLGEDCALTQRPKGIKSFEANRALRSANNYAKRPRLDPQREAMLGKKRGRQTVLLNWEDVKSSGALKSSTPKRQTAGSTINRSVKEIRPVFPNERSDRQMPSVTCSKQGDVLCNDANGYLEPSDCKSESSGDHNSDPAGHLAKSVCSTDLSSESQIPNLARPLKQPLDTKQHKNLQFSARKPFISNSGSSDFKLPTKKFTSKRLNNTVNYYQDTSVERLLREVTNEKFWQHPEEEELQPVPGRFYSAEEYINVFEPLLFEECRAQLYSTWEESLEVGLNYVRVRVKNVERRERGWYDAILVPPNEHKWSFKEGDVAVLSAPRPGSGIESRNISPAVDDEGRGVSGRVAGTVRRHVPIDTRDHIGAILHFYVGDSYESNSKDDDGNILRKLHPGSVWYLTVLGSLATTQREYVALHAFRQLNLQMQTAILQPSSDHFPKYEDQPPAMPDCITPNFVDYLHKTFNGPQLAAIQWAAMHTAAGSNAVAKKQEPWPFTLVQGPPGTGKTHTVWGMLNVIHLVQYQHYYTALLKKLSPESYKQVSESNADNVVVGSIDEVLQSMDQNLFRTLPKLCPKPRMLVCAPSNAATDELLARVLERGFIDGEMKVYRPDVARVGVESQTRAAQAVSVERRTEQLLMKSREEVFGWMQNLKIRESQLSQQISCLQRDLCIAAATGRAQGSVGVDPDVLVARDQNRDTLLRNLAAVVENRDKILVEMCRLTILEARFRPGSNFNLEEARANLEASFANEAEIVFTTVSSSGRKLFSRLTHGFDMVVIDEAAQASEVAMLPPLCLGAARCVLVGDPQQLPATVISKAAGTFLYSRSLFQRFQQAGCPTMLLSIQYRMHPQIRDFPSRHFYQGRLTDSESVTKLTDELYYKDPLLRPYIFFDISHGRESHRGGSVSYQNTQEAQFCVRLYVHLQKSIKSMGMGKVSVGLITPYKLQLKCLQKEFKDILNSDEGKDIYINTVDAFQGQERDVIIMSCVRASNDGVGSSQKKKSNGVGFVADIRRMNVALTRARRALWVMGNASALEQSEDWAALISDAKARQCYLDMDSLPKDFIPESASNALFSSKNSGGRSMRSGPRYQSYYSHADSRSGTPSEDDEKSRASGFFRNGSHRSSSLGAEASLEGGNSV